MLVALPSAIAFGVTIYTPLGASFAAQGALAGILGATALGMVAAMFGGTKRLITAPCAPAAAVLSAFAIEMSQKGTAPQEILMMMMLVALMTAAMQVSFGLLRLGLLIKYMPYPVVSGYLSGVGLIIILSQVPKFLGIPKGTAFWAGLTRPSLWAWQGVVVGVVTIAVMVLAPKLTKAVPAAILGMAAGLISYFALGMSNPAMLSLTGNKLILGPLSASGSGFLAGMADRWRPLGSLHMAQLEMLFFPALTLAVLLSIDTLKTCVVLDALTRSRHNSNRELIGQGLGNLASMAIGGMPGSGQMGATLVNLSSGAVTKFSGVIEGGLALLAFLVLAKAIAWVPIAALAGILIVVGVRMFDRHMLTLLKRRSTILDFVVIVAVVVVAETISLIAASGVGVGLAILLFLREQIGGAVVRRKTYGNQRFSKQARLPRDRAFLEEHGQETVIFELQGSLFFGTTDQLYTALAPELKACRYVILDMRRVASVDFTAAHMLQQTEDMLRERKAYLIFSHLPMQAPSGQDMANYLADMGLANPDRHSLIFEELNLALQWVEDQILADAGLVEEEETDLELHEIELLKGRKPETLTALEAAMEKRSYKAGETIFKHGDTGAELFLIRRGKVSILLPMAAQRAHHVATFGRGDFFGELAFLDPAPRSANCVAITDTDLFALSRAAFDKVTEEHHMLATSLLEALADTIARRLRTVNAELELLQEN